MFRRVCVFDKHIPDKAGHPNFPHIQSIEYAEHAAKPLKNSKNEVDKTENAEHADDQRQKNEKKKRKISGISQPKSQDIPPKSLVFLGFDGDTELLAPTPSRGKPPPEDIQTHETHRTIRIRIQIATESHDTMPLSVMRWSPLVTFHEPKS